ncbi:hypothetical protein [Aquabacterium sp.]|uniref:hypothetical protein n=1 Tax=Aquabacterium sp. TaxID=1872578 RepID=UPI003784599A
MLIRRPLIQLLGLLAMLGATAAAQAVLVSAVPAGIAAKTITFSSYDGVTTTSSFNAPVDVGTAEIGEAVTLTFPGTTDERILGAVNTSLGVNGNWPTSGGFAGLNTAAGTMTFMFDHGVQFVGGFLNFDPNIIDSSTTIAALDQNGDVLLVAGEGFQSYSLDFSFNDPAATGLGQFFGFAVDNPDIWGFALTNGKIVVDNLSFGSAGAAPEPQSLVLVLAALAALGASRSRGRRAPAA